MPVERMQALRAPRIAALLSDLAQSARHGHDQVVRHQVFVLQDHLHGPTGFDCKVRHVVAHLLIDRTDTNHADCHGAQTLSRVDPEAQMAALSDIGTDAVLLQAKCHWGHAYYDTAVGTRHPALDFDLIAAQTDAARRNLSEELKSRYRDQIVGRQQLFEEETIYVSPAGMKRRVALRR